MTDQLVLIEVTNDTRHPWPLNPTFREIGLQGVLMARQALERARSGYVETSRTYENMQNNMPMYAGDVIHHDRQDTAYTGAAA